MKNSSHWSPNTFSQDSQQLCWPTSIYHEGDNGTVDNNVEVLDVLENRSRDFVGFEVELQKTSVGGSGGSGEVVS